MSDAVIASWRVRPPERSKPWLGSIPPKLLVIGGGLLASVALAAVIIWLVGRWGPTGVPLIEADGRPFKVRPDSPGGAVVPNQGELIFERGSARQQDNAANARLGGAPEAPRPEILRAQSQPAPTPAPRAATPPAPAATPAPAPTVIPAPAQQAARPAAAPQGRVQVQFGALRSEEAARQEWERLSRRAPELGGRSPAITRFDRPDGQAPLWRLRTGGFADAAAARAFCEGLRAREVACNVVNPG
ncbi:SPOR domain-containing protein [Roseococcus sp. DSY-14]|uniref:SPOR domain-containing protein n=1 Tax=Roseococcus sp. DSY-14 TaxID=3369650 RepID=UPI00387ACB30